MIITLCGSTKFMKEYINANFWLTMLGNVVLSVGGYHHSDSDPQIRQVIMHYKKNLDVLHKRKIAMSDAILVIDIDNYIGESTKSEIEFAKLMSLPIYSYIKSIDRNKNLRYLEVL